MSFYATAVPEVIIKPGKMIPTSKLKVVVVVLALILYIYVLLSIKTYYLKTKRLDRIAEMAALTEKKILNVHTMEQKLAQQMAHIDKLYEDY